MFAEPDQPAAADAIGLAVAGPDIGEDNFPGRANRVLVRVFGLGQGR